MRKLDGPSSVAFVHTNKGKHAEAAEATSEEEKEEEEEGIRVTLTTTFLEVVLAEGNS